MSIPALPKVLATMMASVGNFVAAAQAQQGNVNQVCPYKSGWKLEEGLVRLIGTIAEAARRSNLCNADLRTPT